MRTRSALGAAAAFLVVAALTGAFVGAADLNPLATAAALADRIPLVRLPSSLSPVDRAVLFQIRLPRVVLGALVGGLLALAGAGYQGVFRNPLVDSGMLGASAGAGLGATLAIVYFGGSGRETVPLAAFVGSLAGVAVAYLTGAAASRRTALGDGVATLLLAGIAVGSFLTAVQTFLLQRSASDIQTVYSWLLGSLSAASWQQVIMILPYAGVSSAVILLHGRHLDVLSVGDEEARTLGMRPGLVRAIVVAASALAAASAVAVSGLIGFVGIVIPHVVRRVAGPSYTGVLPLSLLTGAGFLVLADTLARTVLSPAELPIGVVTAVVGAPAFVWVLRGTSQVST
ncbi:MAG TPA: iron ABC transporter permease [Trebonia sp.]|nr:iron ABC transporter permease [Trebonia sp.]